MLDHKNSSDDLPSYNSINFFCQQNNKEEKAYMAKIKKLQKFIEPLKIFIFENEQKNLKNLAKFKKLVEILEIRDHTQRLNMKVLVNCEAVIEKMKLDGKLDGHVHKCIQCDFSSSQQYDLVMHIESEHSDKHKCPECDSELKEKPEFLQHVNSVHGYSFSIRHLINTGSSKGAKIYKLPNSS